jgi:hypothetical protein
MLRSFHYIDEKGKDQGINGNVTQTLKRPPPLYFSFSRQCGIAQKSSLSFLPMSRKFDWNVRRPRPTELNMSAPVMTGFPLGVVAMEGLEMTRLEVTVVNMGPTRAGTIEVRSWPRFYKILADNPNTEYSGGGSSGGFRDNVSRRNDFEQYDAGDDETSSPRRSTTATTTSQPRSSTTQSKALGKAPEPVPAPIMNLLDFDDNEPGAGSSTAGATTSAAKEKALPALAPLGINENGASLLFAPDVNAKPTYNFDSRWRRRLCRFPGRAIFTPSSPVNVH